MSCKDCNEVATQVKEALHEAKHSHSHLEEISLNLKFLIGIMQRLLTKYREAEGTPKAVPYTIISSGNSAQNTAYTGAPVPYDGVLRWITVSGGGNITVKVNDAVDAGGVATILVIGCYGVPVSLGLRYRIPLNATLSIQSDAAAATTPVTLTAWIEPIVESNPELFRLRR
jgi:hypothetical protein